MSIFQANSKYSYTQNNRWHSRHEKNNQHMVVDTIPCAAQSSGY